MGSSAYVPISPESQDSITLNPKDVRIARKLKIFIMHFLWGSFFPFVSSKLAKEQAEAERQVIIFAYHPGYPDNPGTPYPDPHILDNLIDSMVRSSLSGPSNVTLNNTPAPWSYVLITGYRDLVISLKEILYQYSDRDDRLIEIIDDIVTRTEVLWKIINTVLGNPIFRDDCDQVLLANESLFRYHALCLFKGLQIACEFVPGEDH